MAVRHSHFVRWRWRSSHLLCSLLCPPVCLVRAYRRQDVRRLGGLSHLLSCFGARCPNDVCLPCSVVIRCSSWHSVGGSATIFMHSGYIAQCLAQGTVLTGWYYTYGVWGLSLVGCRHGPHCAMPFLGNLCAESRLCADMCGCTLRSFRSPVRTRK